MGKNKLLLNSTHHSYVKSKWGSNHPRNLKEMRHNIHQAFHVVFANDTPIEQHVRLIELNQNVFQEEFIREMLDLLSFHPKQVYHPDVVRDINKIQSKYYHLDFPEDQEIY